LKKKTSPKAPQKPNGKAASHPDTPQADTISSHIERPQSCVWNQGRLNLRKLCDKNRQCSECPLDRALSESAEKTSAARRQGKIPPASDGRIAFTRERLQLLPKGERPCLLYANGLIDYKICCKDYECVFCEFDRYFSEQHQVHAVVRPLDVLNIRGFRLPQGYYFHMGHAWARIEQKGEVCVGLDDFALNMLGPFDHIEAPLIGNTIQQGQAAISIRRGPHSASIMSPVSGVVATINLSVKENAALAGEDPYARGWILRVRTDNLRQDLKSLLIGSEAVKLLEEEIERLQKEIEMATGVSTPPDTNMRDVIANQRPSIGWETLVRLFLKTT